MSSIVETEILVPVVPEVRKKKVKKVMKVKPIIEIEDADKDEFKMDEASVIAESFVSEVLEEEVVTSIELAVDEAVQEEEDEDDLPISELIKIRKAQAEEEALKEAQELAELEARVKYLKSKQQFANKSTEILGFIRTNLVADVKSNMMNIKSFEESIKRFTEENVMFEEEIAAIDEAMQNGDESIMELIKDKYQDQAEEIIEELEPKVVTPKKVVPKKVASKKDSKTIRVRTEIDRLACRDLLPHRVVLKAEGLHKTDKNMKVSLEIIYNAENKKFYSRDETKTEYKFLQDANREWMTDRGYDKLANAWEDFKALNLVTGKKVSIQMIHIDFGENITDDFIDDDFEF